MAQPEQQAREEIDRLLLAAGWRVCDLAAANIHAARGVAIREFPLESGYGFADYLLYVDGKAAGIIEAKKQGATLTGVESQSARYAAGLPAALPAWRRPLPFLYESTGIETHFTQRPRSRATRPTYFRLSHAGDAGRVAALHPGKHRFHQ
jgi:type I restriction enzyme R subunit